MPYRKKEGRKEESKSGKKELLGVILVLLSAAVSGISFVANKFFVVKIDPLVFTTLRSFIIGVMFLAISLFACNFKINKFKKAPWWQLILIGIIGGGAPFLLFFLGLRETTAGRAAFLHKTLPLYATILAFFFLKDKITRKHTIAMFSMIIGVYLVEMSNISATVRFGDFLVLAATLLWAFENVLSKKVMLEKESNWVVSFSRMFFGSLLLIAVIWYLGDTEMLFSLNQQQIIYVAISSLLLFFYIMFWYWGLRHINLSKASSILLIAPIITMILGVAFLHENVSLLQILGSAIILAGAYIIIRIKSEKRVIES